MIRLFRWKAGLLMGAFAAVGMLGAVACGAAEEPTPTSAPAATPTTALAKPTPTWTPAPTPTPAVRVKLGGILNVAARADFSNIDPMYGASITDGQLTAGDLWSTNLVRPNPLDVYTFEPHVAERWTVSDDFTVWTLTIRDNVYWHDGVKFTAADAKFWIDLMYNPPTGRKPDNIAPALGPIAKTETPDPMTLRVTFSKPWPNWFDSWVDMGTRMAAPKHTYEPEIAKGNVTVSPDQVGWLGTGPFKFVEYRKGSLFRLERFPQYFLNDKEGRQLPYLDEVQYQIIKDRGVMLAAFRAGRIDITARGFGFHLTAEQIEATNRDLGKDGWWYADVLYLPVALGFNQNIPPFNDVNLRRAIQIGIDRKAGIEAVYGGLGTISGLIGPQYENPDFHTWPGFRTDPAGRAEDLAEAKRLIRENGYEGLEVQLLVRDSDLYREEWVASELRGLGLNVKMDVVDGTTWSARNRAGDYQMNRIGAATLVQPAIILNTIDQKNPGTAARRGWNDDFLQGLLESFNATPSSKKQERLETLQKMERYLLTDTHYLIRLWWERAVWAHQNYVKGVRVPAVDSQYNLDHETVWLDK